MNETDPTAPIRKSSLPTTLPPEWEFHTWFPHPDGGGDMVPGERQRGILVRRLVTWGDWEPVRPDHWADEPKTDETAAASAVVAPPTDRAACDCEAEVHMGVGFYHHPWCATRRAAVLGEPTDRADLRGAVAGAVRECLPTMPELASHVTNAVLTVLPEATGRAAVLGAAADALPDADLPFVSPMGRRQTADWLRRLAVEAQQPDGRCPACGHTVCDGDGPCGARSGDDFCTCPGPAPVAQQPAAEAQAGCAHRGPHPGFTCAEVDQTRLFWDGRWDEAPAEQQAAAADGEETLRARAALYREVADTCDEAGGAYASRALNDHAAGAFDLMEHFIRKANEAEFAATPCDPMVPCEDGGEPCSTHERLMAHAEGDHELCAPDCSMPRP